MRFRRPWGAIAASLMLIAGLSVACVSGQATGAEDSIERPAAWSEDSHGDSAAPDYGVVFPAGQVNQITITISPDDWAAMQANMTELLGAPGTRRGPGGQPGQQGQAREQGQQPRAGGQGQTAPEGAGQLPGAAPAGERGPGGIGGAPDMTPENPMWVPATIEFGGKSWTNVGVRYKGNSSLQQAWSSSSPKMGLKLDFDQFEAEHPEIENQRFFGFKQLSLSSNWGDASYMRETIAYDLLEEAGLPAANTALHEVVLDHGEGKQTLGIYTMVEVIDDTVVDRVFGEDSGNIYEADGPAASLAQGMQAQISSSFQKENNEKGADWSDVQALYDALHSELRTTDPSAWRAELEGVFDTEGFLEWLAIAAAIGHWDTYGQMSHNYYLYDDPDTGKLTWISWDHNYILGSGPVGRAPGGMPAQTQAAGAAGQVPAGAAPQAPAGRGGMGGRGSVTLDRKSTGTNWPLIRYLLDDPVYYAKYLGYLEDAGEMLSAPDLESRYQKIAEALAPYAAKEGGQQSYEAAVESLMQAIQDRAKAVSDFLSSQPAGTR